MSLFRDLDAEERIQFERWAKNTFEPNMQVDPLWHPVVRETLAALQRDYEADLLQQFDQEEDKRLSEEYKK